MTLLSEMSLAGEHAIASARVRRTLAAIQECLVQAGRGPVWTLLAPDPLFGRDVFLARLSVTRPTLRRTYLMVTAGSVDELRILLPEGIEPLPAVLGDNSNALQTLGVSELLAVH